MSDLVSFISYLFPCTGSKLAQPHSSGIQKAFWNSFPILGQVMGEEMNVPPGSWQEAVSGLRWTIDNDNSWT